MNTFIEYSHPSHFTQPHTIHTLTQFTPPHILTPHTPSQEFYGDYIAVAHHLFSLNLEVAGEPGGLWKRAEFLRTCDGLVSLLLALRKRPSIR